MRGSWIAILIGAVATACGSGGGGGSNGGSWTEVHNQGLTNDVGGSITSDGNRIIVATSKGVFVSSDDGATWPSSATGLPAGEPIEDVIALDDRVLAGVDVVYASKDHGMSWTESDMGLPHTVSVYKFFNTGTSLLVGMNTASGEPGMSGGLFRSSDKGMSWQMSSSGLQQNAGGTSFVMLGSAILVSFGSAVSASSDDGKTWTPNPLPSGNALSLVTIGGTVFVSSSANTVYKSTDGKTWTDAGHGLPSDPSDFMLAADGVLYATAFASGNSGVYISRDNGGSWSAFNEGLMLPLNSIPRLLQIIKHGSAIYGVDEAGNIWRRSL
jgi:photosystem II stability/assembly factor-like uncharacterized protein